MGGSTCAEFVSLTLNTHCLLRLKVKPVDRPPYTLHTLHPWCVCATVHLWIFIYIPMYQVFLFLFSAVVGGTNPFALPAGKCCRRSTERPTLPYFPCLLFCFHSSLSSSPPNTFYTIRASLTLELLLWY